MANVDDAFMESLRSKPISAPETPGMCCGVKMHECEDRLQCTKCGKYVTQLTEAGEYPSTDFSESSLMRCISIKGTYSRDGQNQYPKIQYKALYTLYKLKNDTAGNIIPEEFLHRAVVLCQKILEKGLRRAGILLEIMASCLFYTCIECHLPMKHSEIAEFMKFKRKGFPRGEKIVRLADETGIIHIPREYFPRNDYIIRYMKIFNLVTDPQQQIPDFTPFIFECADVVTQNHIAYGSDLATKMLGVVWKKSGLLFYSLLTFTRL